VTRGLIKEIPCGLAALNVELAAGVLTLVDLIGQCVCVRIVDQPPREAPRFLATAVDRFQRVSQ
jgi:hypothetical protein